VRSPLIARPRIFLTRMRRKISRGLQCSRAAAKKLVVAHADGATMSQFASFKSERTLIRPVPWLARAGCDRETGSSFRSSSLR
jgi:hypothetical protein